MGHSCVTWTLHAGPLQSEAGQGALCPAQQCPLCAMPRPSPGPQVSAHKPPPWAIVNLQPISLQQGCCTLLQGSRELSCISEKTLEHTDHSLPLQPHGQPGCCPVAPSDHWQKEMGMLTWARGTARGCPLFLCFCNWAATGQGLRAQALAEAPGF